MEKKNKFKVVSVNKTRYILPSVLTLVGVCLGISSIKFAMDGNFSFAVLFLVVAAILDGLDGRVARLINAQSEFGAALGVARLAMYSDINFKNKEDIIKEVTVSKEFNPNLDKIDILSKRYQIWKDIYSSNKNIASSILN